MRHLFGSTVIIAASVLVIGCSDDESSADCSFTDCGGDLVGTWHVKNTCLGAFGEDSEWEDYPACSDAVFSDTPIFTGTLIFRDDGGFSYEFQVRGGSRSVMDDDCIAEFTDEMMTSEAFCDVMQEMMTEGDTTASCTYKAGKCTCNVTYDYDISARGTYITLGNKVTLSFVEEDEGREDVMDYCVSGDELKMLDVENALTVFEK